LAQVTQSKLNNNAGAASKKSVLFRGWVPMNNKLQVMILDDEPIVGKRLKAALTKSEIDVEVFENALEAVNRIKEKKFDIVVTDIRMEEINGIQVLEHVMKQSDRTKVIIITGYATIEVAREALAKGAFDFIAKPFKPNELRAVINKAALSLGYNIIAPV
jgi:DNA-binding NtrC family response regulator